MDDFISTHAPRRYESENSPYGLYASPQTAEQLGWMTDHIPAWAGSDVLVLQTGDVVNVVNSLDVLGPAGDNFSAEYYGAVSSAHPDNFADLHANGTVFSSMLSALSNEPGAFAPISRDDLCIITVPDIDYELGNLSLSPPLEGEAGNHYANFISGGLLDDLRAGQDIVTPGALEDWKVIITTHEATHCQQEPMLASTNENIDNAAHIPEILEREIEADQGGITAYYNALADGDVSSPELIQTFIDVRALSAMSPLARGTHVTGVALSAEPPFAVLPHDEAPQIHTEWQQMREVIRERLDGMMEGTAYESMSRLHPEFERLQHMAITDLNEEEVFAHSEIQQRYVDQYLGAVDRLAPQDHGLTFEQLMRDPVDNFVSAFEQEVDILTPPESLPESEPGTLAEADESAPNTQQNPVPSMPLRPF